MIKGAIMCICLVGGDIMIWYRYRQANIYQHLLDSCLFTYPRCRGGSLDLALQRSRSGRPWERRRKEGSIPSFSGGFCAI